MRRDYPFCSDFLHGYEKMDYYMNVETTYKFVFGIVLVVNLIRIIQCLSLHPRLALITGTFASSADDLCHTIILFAAFTGCYVYMLSWRFGDEREEFATIVSTIHMLLIFTFEGGFSQFVDNCPDGSSLFQCTPWQLTAYQLIYIFVVFIFLMSFILAIIVEAYSHVRQHNIALEIEQAFFSDVWELFGTAARRWIYGWPPPRVLGRQLLMHRSKFNVNYTWLRQTGLFPSQRAVVSMIRYYHRYDFCRPVKVTRFGLPPQSEREKMLTDLETRVAALLGTRRLSLRETALQAGSRRASTGCLSPGDGLAGGGGGGGSPSRYLGEAGPVDCSPGRRRCGSLEEKGLGEVLRQMGRQLDAVSRELAALRAEGGGGAAAAREPPGGGLAVRGPRRRSRSPCVEVDARGGGGGRRGGGGLGGVGVWRRPAAARQRRRMQRAGGGGGDDGGGGDGGVPLRAWAPGGRRSSSGRGARRERGACVGARVRARVRVRVR